MDSLLQDIRFAFRSLMGRRFLTLVAAFSLAIGIGVNAAIFSAVDVFMFRPFPYPESENLDFIWTTNQERGWSSTSSSIPDFLDWRNESRTMELAAFLLALVGVYGVMAYTVSRRLQEIGIRMALGADSNSVRMLILKQGATLATIGIGLGTLLSLGVTRGLSFFLFGVSPFHLPTFLGVAGALLGAAVVATILPARRATRIDPIDALRSE